MRAFSIPCLKCGKLTKAGSYCRDHARKANPAYSDREYLKNRKVVLDQWVKEMGNVCPGIPGHVEPHQCERLTIDHHLPVAHGGGHEVENLVPRCRSCNSKRGALINRGGVARR